MNVINGSIQKLLVENQTCDNMDDDEDADDEGDMISMWRPCFAGDTKSEIQHNIDTTRQSACLVVNPITVYSYNIWLPLYLHDGGSGLGLNDSPDVKL